MSYELTELERNAALRLNADYRYEHFISKVARSGELWALKDENGLLFLKSDNDETCLPVWPHAEYAQLWAVGDQAHYQPQSITLKIWLERWIDGLTQDGIAVTVFPIQGEENLVEEPSELAESLNKKLEQYAQEA